MSEHFNSGVTEAVIWRGLTSQIRFTAVLVIVQVIFGLFLHGFDLGPVSIVAPALVIAFALGLLAAKVDLAIKQLEFLKASGRESL